MAELSLVQVTILSQVLNGVLLPVVMIFMLVLINKTDLMGKNTNNPLVQYLCVVDSDHRHRTVAGDV